MQVLFILMIKIKKTELLYKLHFFPFGGSILRLLQNQILSKRRGPTYETNNYGTAGNCTFT
jgi:hypothetical protein